MKFLRPVRQRNHSESGLAIGFHIADKKFFHIEVSLHRRQNAIPEGTAFDASGLQEYTGSKITFINLPVYHLVAIDTTDIIGILIQLIHHLEGIVIDEAEQGQKLLIDT